METLKSNLLVLCCIVVLSIVSGCQQNDLVNRDDVVRKSENYKYSETIKLTDESGKFYVHARISSDNEYSVKQYVANPPTIRVWKTSETPVELLATDTGELIQGPKPVEKHKESSVFGVEFTSDRNIPEGYSMQIIEHPDAFKPQSNNKSEVYQTYYFSDSYAKGIYTRVFVV